MAACLDDVAVRFACGIGRCGACTVLVDGAPAAACLLQGWQVEGRYITTMRGLDDDPLAAVVRAAMTQANAFQCGYCAPGIIIALVALLRDGRKVSEEDVRTALEGNLCRCTGYASILRGAMLAVEAVRVLSNEKPK